MNTVYALVDCNNFFVSCERVFQPKLKNFPLMVLSNNDGCVVARSNEVKELGIPMGVPIYKVKDIVNRHGIKTLSSNFELYSDMSRRVMEVITRIAPAVQIYSIDEAFLIFEGDENTDWLKVGKNIRSTVYQATGIPVSVGFAYSKTLAKLANRWSKKHPESNGVFNMLALSQEELDNVLRETDIGDVWGVGYRTTDKFRKIGIVNAYDYKYMDSSVISNMKGINGYRTQLELKGIPCFINNYTPDFHKSMAYTRTFGNKVSTLPQLKEVFATYIANVAVKLREEKCVARSIYLFLEVGYKNRAEIRGCNVKLETHSADTNLFINVVLPKVAELFTHGLIYRRAGVSLSDILPKSHVQLDLFTDENQFVTIGDRFGAIDLLNQKWGKKILKVGAEGFSAPWSSNKRMLSNRYTTDWSELAIVRAS